MPYQGGDRLSGERASKLGHLEIVKSTFVQSLIDQFEYPTEVEDSDEGTPWQALDLADVQPLTAVIAVDGSLQTVASDGLPKRALSFVKTALVRLDRRAIEKIDKRMPHPVLMRELMRESALQAATVFPLRNVRVPGLTNYDLVRNIIRDSLRIEADGLAHDTLKWLAYQKWSTDRRSSPRFACPHLSCGEETKGLPYDADDGTCEHCGGELYLSDMIGFHREMSEDVAAESLATAYMLIHETLLLFSVIRFFWQQGDFGSLRNVLLIKDGPLTLRGQYSKLVPCIRNLFAFAKDKACPIHLIGQEKTGAFVDHLSEIGRFAPPQTLDEPPSFAVLSHRYVREKVQLMPDRDNEYGLKTNYGEKVLVKLDPYCQMVISVPTGQYLDHPDKPATASDLIGLRRILATLPSLVSYHNEGALIPINLANGVASLSSYPSAKVLKLFAGL
ncbi:MAG: hypothetical protein HOY79_18960 [Streptomyces sp.]|nr:hypothetical protein [Streptomyces sp.]